MFELTAYCDDCSFEILARESDDLGSLTEGFEAHFEVLYHEHQRNGDCR